MRIDNFTELFERDIAKHVMEEFRDDGVNRHIRFRRPGTMCMHFDLLTWPGYLCYTGDMGTYVFTRLQDMFEFFRCENHEERYQISMNYWAEKIRAADRDGVSEFSAESFKSNVRDYFEQNVPEEWPERRKAELWAEIEQDVIGELEDIGEHGAWSALFHFNFDGFRFRDWEHQCREYTHRFRWCCHALRWAIAKYDESRVKAAA